MWCKKKYNNIQTVADKNINTVFGMRDFAKSREIAHPPRLVQERNTEER